MERGEAQAAGWIGFDEGRSLFGGVAEPTTAVNLQDGVMGSSHHPPRNDCDAAIRLESSDGGVDYVYASKSTLVVSQRAASSLCGRHAKLYRLCVVSNDVSDQNSFPSTPRRRGCEIFAEAERHGPRIWPRMISIKSRISFITDPKKLAGAHEIW